MNTLIKWIFVIFLQVTNLTEISCKKQKSDYFKDIELKDLRDTLKSIFKKQTHPIDRRSANNDVNDIKFLREALSNIHSLKFKNWLRHEAIQDVEEAAEPEAEGELEGLVENELLNALSKKSSALLDRPFVQKKGRNDFLVIRPDLQDPFVTIVPNDIYYNSEKKCVNWLDDCNQKGLRERLLQKVNSPYKK